MRQKNIRIPARLLREFESWVEQQGYSVANEAYLEAIKHFMKCDASLPDMQNLKLIILRYDGTCKKCNEVQKAGSWAYYGKGFGVLCLDCLVTRMGDKAMAKKFLKMKQLKAMIKALEQKAETLAEDMEDFNVYEMLDNLFQMAQKQHDLLIDYLRQDWTKEEETKKLEEVDRLTEDIKRLIDEIRLWLVPKAQKKKKIRM